MPIGKAVDNFDLVVNSTGLLRVDNPLAQEGEEAIRMATCFCGLKLVGLKGERWKFAGGSQESIVLIGDSIDRIAGEWLAAGSETYAVVRAFLHGTEKRAGRGAQVRVKRLVLDVSLIDGNDRDERESGQELKAKHGDDETPGNRSARHFHRSAPRNL
ncbi:MAG: hypothetical protein WB439_06460 [Acidobacteriaceae bacterium]